MGHKSGKNSVLVRTPGVGGAKVTPLRPAGATPPPTAKTEVSRERIAERAYEIWVQQGCRHGWDRQHWLEAERQLKAESGLA
jgi:hypothetical protein